MKKKIILVIASLFVAFFVSVIVDRFLGIYLNKIGYFKAMVPNVTKIYDTNEFNIVAKTSSQGIRNDEVNIPKPKNTFRILAIGDSFTYGWGVDLDKTWIKLLEKKLQVKNKKVEIVNAGDPGIGLTRIRQVCRAYESQFDPDVIFIDLFYDDLYQAAAIVQEAGFFQRLLENYWPTLARIRSPIIFDNAWVSVKRGETVKISDGWKAKVTDALKKNPRLLLIINPNLRNDFLKGRINPGLIFQAAADPYFWLYVLDNEKFNFALKSTDERLRILKERCGNNIPVVFIFVPSPELVSDYYHRYKTDLGYVMDQDLVKFNLDSYLKNIIEQKGFKYISVLGEMRKNGCTDCYYKYDLHFTEKGNKQFAEHLLPKIQNLLNNFK